MQLQLVSTGTNFYAVGWSFCTVDKLDSKSVEINLWDENY